MKDNKQRMRIRNVLTMAVTLPHHNHHRQQQPLPCVYREILGLYYIIIHFEFFRSAETRMETFKKITFMFNNISSVTADVARPCLVLTWMTSCCWGGMVWLGCAWLQMFLGTTVLPAVCIYDSRIICQGYYKILCEQPSSSLKIVCNIIEKGQEQVKTVTSQ